MTYSATLGGSRQLAIANVGEQTQINVTMSLPGQQQSQGSSFSTGRWVSEPKLFQLEQGYVLAVNTNQNSHYILIQQNSISTIESPINLDRYPRIDLTTISESNVAPVQSMQPMQPLKMGNMSMNLNSMSMQMGNMSMSLNKQSKTSLTKQFCSQCGTEAKISDRFCRSCGHELNR